MSYQTPHFVARVVVLPLTCAAKLLAAQNALCQRNQERSSSENGALRFRPKVYSVVAGCGRKLPLIFCDLSFDFDLAVCLISSPSL